MSEEKLSQEVRDAVRAFRYHTGQSYKMLGVKSHDLSIIETGCSISKEKTL